MRGEAFHRAVCRQQLSPTEQLGLLRAQWRAGAPTGNSLPWIKRSVGKRAAGRGLRQHPFFSEAFFLSLKELYSSPKNIFSKKFLEFHLDREVERIAGNGLALGSVADRSEVCCFGEVTVFS